MRVDAIQKRDVIGPRKKKNAVNAPVSSNYKLIKQEETTQLPSKASVSSDSYIMFFKQLQDGQRQNLHTFYGLEALVSPPLTRRGHEQDINGMMTSGIVHASSWLENTPVFRDLPKETKRDVLREFSLVFMTMENGAVSARQSNPNLYVLPNGAYLHVDYRQGLTEEELRRPGVDVKATQHADFLEELIRLVVSPLRTIQADDFEIAAMKCLLLFMHRKQLTEEQDRSAVDVRDKCLGDLMQYCCENHPENAASRFGNIVLSLGNFMCSTNTIGKRLQLSQIFNYMKFNALINNLLFS